LDGAEPRDAGTTQLSSPVCRRGGQQDPLGIAPAIFKQRLAKSGLYNYILSCATTS